MRTLGRTLLASAVLSGMFPAMSMAVSFDFTSLGSNNTQLANSVIVGTVKAEGLDYGTNTSPQGNTPSAVPLWLRVGSDDNGLGVCSEVISDCSNGGGDVNELSNQFHNEAIRLTKPGNELWNQLYVSSLDSGGSNSAEKGKLFWSTTANGFTDANSVDFTFSNSCDVECDLLAVLGLNAIDPTANYLLFMNNASNGSNNDYLLWKGLTIPRPGGDIPPQEVPEPTTLALLGAGLLGLGMARRRFRG